MWSYFAKKTKRFRSALGLASGAWKLLVMLGIAAVPTFIVAWLTWGRDHPGVVIVIILVALACSLSILNSVMQISERVLVFRRVRFQQLEPFIVEIGPTVFHLSTRARLVNRAQVPVEIHVQHVRLTMDGRSNPTEDVTDAEPIFALPNEHGWAIIGTVQGLARAPQKQGLLYLDVHYGPEGEPPEYRMEHRCEVELFMAGNSLIMSTRNNRETHTRLSN